MGFDAALDAILAIEGLWLARRGRVRLSDLGVAPYGLVRSRPFPIVRRPKADASTTPARGEGRESA
jgi:hypothetical protein